MITGILPVIISGYVFFDGLTTNDDFNGSNSYFFMKGHAAALCRWPEDQKGAYAVVPVGRTPTAAK